MRYMICRYFLPLYGCLSAFLMGSFWLTLLRLRPSKCTAFYWLLVSPLSHFCHLLKFWGSYQSFTSTFQVLWELSELDIAPPDSMCFVSLHFRSALCWPSPPRTSHTLGFLPESFVSCLKLYHPFSPVTAAFYLPYSHKMTLVLWPFVGPSVHFLRVSPSLASLDFLGGGLELAVPVSLFPYSFFHVTCPEHPSTLDRCYSWRCLILRSTLNRWMLLQIDGLR